ncbi:MAG: bifunctional hydroxymethylpyrimidine kinase/phosphomethylpyrimidine kinase [Deltaproteobacteria bacterium]|nr:bifunctional hydroxymethylpyrimidine kinase/phosphomethylpyrimidine kinase [Deltaproteobacteria bacterium]
MSASEVKIALTVAGSDSGGGAGIQADLKTFAALGTHGLSAITALTAQSTTEVRAIHEVPADFVRLQLETLGDDFRIDAAKTGMLASPSVIEEVALFFEARPIPLVVDPVMVASSGARLVGTAAAQVIVERLFPRAALITPNLDEVEILLGQRPQDVDEMTAAGRELLTLGPAAVLVKGGHLSGDPTDVLVTRSATRQFTGPRIPSSNTHGTGCTYAAAITALLAHGLPLLAAVETARTFLRGAIAHAPTGVGRGAGPLHPLHQVVRFRPPPVVRGPEDH